MLSRHFMQSIFAFIAAAAVLLGFTPGALGQYAGVGHVRLAQIAAVLPAAPAGFGVPCEDRASWTRVAANYRQDVVEANAYLAKPLPKWSNAAYMEYWRTGNRRVGEAMINRRQNELAPLVLAECSTWNGKYLPRITELLDSLAREKSWAVPGNDIDHGNFSGPRHFVTLNSATLGHAIAEALYLLGNKLSVQTRERAQRALEAQIFQPMIQAYNGEHAPWWLTVHDNWNAVCLNGVTDAALTALADRRERAFFLAEALRYSDNFIKEFRDGGYDPEGIGYWNYGFSNYEELREQIWLSTRGRIDLFANPVAREAALFGIRFQMLPGVYADFGDARFMTQPAPVLLFRIAKAFGLQSSGIPSTTPASAYRGQLPSAVLASFPNPSELGSKDADRVSARHSRLRTYYSNPGVLVDRPSGRDGLAITIKANGNTAHSHNDKGSFSIGLDGTQPLGDPGGPAFYTAQTFSKDRYNSRLLNSFGHPVPEVAGHLQRDATRFNVHVLSTHFTPRQDSITMDLTQAYRAPSLRKLVRTMKYSRKGHGKIEIEDTYWLNRASEIIESLPTHGTYKVTGHNALRVRYKTASLKILISCPARYHVTSEPVDDYGNPFTRIEVRFRLPAGRSRVLMTFQAASQQRHQPRSHRQAS